MTTDIRREYRLVWPDGEELADSRTESMALAMQKLQDMREKLKLIMPESKLPVLETHGVEIVRTEFPWERVTPTVPDWAEAKSPGPKLGPMESGKHAAPVPTGAFIQKTQHVWIPLADQIDRVKSRQFGWLDPCVICGQRFTDCPHDNSETETFINRVKAYLKGTR